MFVYKKTEGESKETALCSLQAAVCANLREIHASPFTARVMDTLQGYTRCCCSRRGENDVAGSVAGNGSKAPLCIIPLT